MKSFHIYCACWFARCAAHARSIHVVVFAKGKANAPGASSSGFDASHRFKIEEFHMLWIHAVSLVKVMVREAIGVFAMARHKCLPTHVGLSFELNDPLSLGRAYRFSDRLVIKTE
jgi:hypothetical protein